jgi:hypothetical protein
MDGRSGRRRGLLPRVLSRLLPQFLLLVVVLPGAIPAAAQGHRPVAGAAKLRIIARSPVLVRTGEAVHIPVDVVCSTPRGTVCPSTVALRIGSNVAGWRSVRASAAPGLRFDVTAPTRAALPAAGVSGRSGAVSFRITATAAATTASLPGTGEGSVLRYYVAAAMPAVAVPPVPFGDVDDGSVALYLPWGTGQGRAGLVPGIQSATVGPSSFDVDGAGRILVADELQDRVALFQSDGFVRQTAIQSEERTDVAFAAGGGAFVATSPAPGRPRSTVTSVDDSGRVQAVSAVGAGGDEVSEVRAAGANAWVHLLPLDAWVPAAAATASQSTGMPLAGGGQLLSVVDGNAVRLGTVAGGVVTGAVELRFQDNVGELPLAEPDGAGGYLAVVHMWREDPTAADQYEVVHVRSDHTVSTFAVANHGYAESLPLSKFRLGGDGALYALQSDADGVRVVRYELGGIR